MFLLMSKDKSKRVLNKLNNEVDFHFLLQLAKQNQQSISTHTKSQ